MTPVCYQHFRYVVTQSGRFRILIILIGIKFNVIFTIFTFNSQILASFESNISIVINWLRAPVMSSSLSFKVCTVMPLSNLRSQLKELQFEVMFTLIMWLSVFTCMSCIFIREIASKCEINFWNQIFCLCRLKSWYSKTHVNPQICSKNAKFISMIGYLAFKWQVRVRTT